MTKSELEELGEDMDNVVSSSKLRDLVRGYTGVDIMKSKTEYKDLYEIISEIGDKWKDINDVQKAALLEALAGKRQANALAAILNNHERLAEIYQTAEESAGSAMREQRKYQESIQYSVDQLTAHGEEFWNTVLKTDDIKYIIELINDLISGLTKLASIEIPILGNVGTPVLAGGALGVVSYLKDLGRPKMFGLN